MCGSFCQRKRLAFIRRYMGSSWQRAEWLLVMLLWQNTIINTLYFIQKRIILVGPVVQLPLLVRMVRMAPLILVTPLARSDQLVPLVQLAQLALLAQLAPLHR